MQTSSTFNRHTVLDTAGHKVGTVSDVVSDATTLEPRWLVVDTGLLRTSHYVPITGISHTNEGELVVPFTKETVSHAPKANGSHVLSETEETELATHYGLQN
jgi:sporulation protein YlmC with PRC-barrel domain